MSSEEIEKAIEASQDQLGRSLDRARMGEDKDLAARVRDLGERLVRLLYGLLKMTEIHALDNNAFKKPSQEFSNVTETLMELLGAIHIVTVEDQVFVNDIRIRFGRATNATSLSEELAPHQVGGLSLHQAPKQEQVLEMVRLFSAPPAEEVPRGALIEQFADNNLDFVDLLGIYRFRITGEAQHAKKDLKKISVRAASLVDEAWDNLGASRTPNPLPLRRAVTDILQQSDDASGLVENPKSESRYGDHSLQVCRLSLLLAQAARLSEENLQDLGVAAMFHDMGYAAREGADPKNGEEGFPPPFERHSAAGARMLLRQRGFHQAKIKRVLSALEHHRDYNYSGGKPHLFARVIRIAEDYSNMTSRRGGGFNPQEALSRMASGSGTRYDPVLLQVFINQMGLYPPGTILEVEIDLPSGMQTFILLASSLCDSSEKFALPKCKLLLLPDGTECPASYANKMVDLAEKKHRVLQVLNDY